MSNMSNVALITEGFEKMRPSLVAFLVREMRILSGNRWWYERVRSVLRDHQSMDLPDSDERDDVKCMDALDIHRALLLIDVSWNDVFKLKMTREQRTWVKELQGTRNRWAHNAGEGFSDDDTWRALDTMARLMENIDKDTSMEIRDMLRKAQYGGSGISTQVSIPPPPPPVQAPQSVGGLKPWRAVAMPHDDVARGIYRQAEFAADLSTVLKGTAVREYQDPVDFFARTYITEGIRTLLINALQRVCGKSGDPVIQVKTAFGGGKTHSMLALYHLMRNGSNASRLPGVAPLLKDAEVNTVPDVRVAVLVGTALNPTIARRPINMPGITINTLWGEMAAQLAEQAGDLSLYNIIKESDRQHVSPGSDTFAEFFRRIGPCVILLDEFVVYARKIYGTTDLPAGNFENLLSFVQELTEACKKCDNVLLVASLPESEVELGGEAGRIALEHVERIFGRVENIWKSAGQDEGFEIVRRRLFKDITDKDAVDAAVRTYTQSYQDHTDDFPPECRELAYQDRMRACYPIHPEVFDRLYEDWATLELFQRTRGVLRLMATVIFDLWSNGNADPLIMPGSINFGNTHIREELSRYLPSGWPVVIDREVNASPAQIEREKPQYARVGAVKRVARTILLGSAPDVKEQKTRGLEEARLLLGVAHPGEAPALFRDVINYMQEKLSYLYSSNRRYWYDTRPTLRKTVQDRAVQKSREDAEYEIEKLINDRAKEPFRDTSDFAGVHRCPSSSAEVPDDQTARLVILRPSEGFSRNDVACKARVTVRAILETRGGSPRIHRNMLCFLAPDADTIISAVNEMKMLMAWKSVLDDKLVLNLDNAQEREATEAIERSTKTVYNRIMDAYCWLLVPYQTGTDPIAWEENRVTGIENIIQKANRKVKSDEALITSWSPYLLKLKLDQHLWQGKHHIGIKELWGYLTDYCYLPRLLNISVLQETLHQGLTSSEYFAYAEGIDAATGKYVALTLGKVPSAINIQTGLLVRKEIAQIQIDAGSPQPTPNQESEAKSEPGSAPEPGSGSVPGATPGPKPPQPAARPRRYYASGTLAAGKAGSGAGKIDEEVLFHLSRLPGAQVEIQLNIQVKVPGGIPDDVLRIITENSQTLKLEAGVEEE